MSSIRWVCISDLHLGALNSLLTNVAPDGERIDASSASPVLTALCACLRSLHADGTEPPELVVLGDLFELALTAPEDAAATFSQFVAALRPDGVASAISSNLRFLPGNHDHHLWTRASDDRYVHLLGESASAAPTARDRHATSLLPSNDRVAVRDRFVETLANRVGPSTPITVEQSYPNLGFVDGSGQRAVVVAHGHYVEPLYRMMSLLDRALGTPRSTAPEAWQVEADNGGWIDFFWSSMGDSGDITRITRSLYESLQSHETLHAEIEAVERAIKTAGRSRARADVEAHAAALLLEAGVGTMLRERHRRGVVLSPQGEEGLAGYLEGPVAAQVRTEIGHPDAMTFVFGHTHKPFVSTREVEVFATPTGIANTGGWVVDTAQPDAIKGGAIVLVDDELNVVSLRCYAEGPTEDAYRPRIDAVSTPGANPLADELATTIDADHEPWSTLAASLRDAVAERGRQLGERLRQDTSELDRLNRETGQVAHPKGPNHATAAG